MGDPALALYNSGSRTPGPALKSPVISQQQFERARSSSHSFKSPLSPQSTHSLTSVPSFASPHSPKSLSQYPDDSIAGDYSTLMDGKPVVQLKKYLEPFSKDELQTILLSLATNNDKFCQQLLEKIKTESKWCKLFVRGLDFSTTKDTLQSHFSEYGPIKEAVILVDKKGNSKGYGFVNFENANYALKAAKDPKKRIDSRQTYCNLAFKGNPKKKFLSNNSGSGPGLSPKQRENANDRRLFVHSLAWKTDDNSLASTYAKYGELQEAVVIRDKKTGKSKGYGFVTFKHSEDAMRALVEPFKKIDGRMTECNFACEGNNNGGSEKVNSPNPLSKMVTPNIVLAQNSNSSGPALSNSFHSNPMPTTYTSNNLNQVLPGMNPIPSSMSSSSQQQRQRHSAAPMLTNHGSYPSYHHPPPPASLQHPHSYNMHSAAAPSTAHSRTPLHESTLHPLMGSMQNPIPSVNVFGGPNSPMPGVLSGISNLGLSSVLNAAHMRGTNMPSQGNGQLPGTHPSNLVLNPSQTATNNHSSQVVVGPAVASGNLFPNPPCPSTPPFAHTQTTTNPLQNSNDVQTASPYQNGLNSVNMTIPKFPIGTLSMNGGLETISNTATSVSTSTQPPMQRRIIVSSNPIGNLQPQPLGQRINNMMMNGNGNGNGNKSMNNGNIVNVNNKIKEEEEGDDDDEDVDKGNTSPKSQCVSDDVQNID